MTYTRRLLLSKIVITLCWIGMVIPPVFFTVVSENGSFGERVSSTQFSLAWLLMAQMFYLPVLLYLVWGRLHGTGRSVRAVAFLGMGYVAAFFVTYSGRIRFKPESMTVEQFDVALGQGSHFGHCGVMFALLLLAVVLSVKSRKLS